MSHAKLSESEEVARLLFADSMVAATTGKLKTEAFPVDELVEIEGRDGKAKSVSVDRCCQLNPLKETLQEKASKFENPKANRSKWGFAIALTEEIRSIQTPDRQQVFDVFEDPVLGGYHPKWDCAHAKLVRAHQNHTRSLIRGYRDTLIEVFSKKVEQFPDECHPQVPDANSEPCLSENPLESLFSRRLRRFFRWCKAQVVRGRTRF